MNFENKTQFIEWLNQIQASKQKDSLDRVFDLLSKSNNPQNQIKNIIHITGTNGKTSTAKFIQSALTSQGYKTGLFISPYVEEFNERIQVDNQNIDDQNLIKIANQIYPSISDQNQFEILVVIMLIYFANLDLDYVVIEVGIGGLYDSTNIFKIPKTVVITNVSLDHQEILGDSIEKITEQKAGIITENSNVVLGPSISKRAISVIKRIAQEKMSKVLTTQISSIDNYQDYNLETAQKVIDLVLLDNHLKINQVAVAGRLEFFDYHNRSILLDGAHNQAGIESLFNYLNNNFDHDIDIIFSALQIKNSPDFLPTDTYPNIHLVNFEFNKPTISGVDWQIEFDRILEVNSKKINNPIVFTGSLYFISQVREYLLKNGARKKTNN